MRRFLTFAAVWVAGTSLAVSLAWWGLSSVGTEVTTDRAPVLSAGQLAEVGAATTTSTEPARPPTSAPSTTAATAPTDPSAPPPTAPPATSPPPTTPATATPAAAEVRTYHLVGGSAAVRFEPGRVSLVWATPNDGFAAELHQDTPAELEVRFEGDGHRSRLKAKWEGGPVDEVREEPDSSG